MDIFHKKHTNSVKMSGLDSSLDLDEDALFKPDYEEAHRRKIKEEEMKQRLRNKHFDPTYMECDLPDPPDTGSISLDPNDMTFNFK